MAKAIAQILLNRKAVAINTKKLFTYASGTQSPIYCDNRLLLSFPEDRAKIVRSFVSKIKKVKCDIIAGTATAGIPWAALIAGKLKKPLIYVRGKAKEHGKGNQIEGLLKKGSNVVVIEDLISTGGSSLACVDALRKAGGKVSNLYAIFTYKFKSSEEAVKKSKVELTVLTNINELSRLAINTQYISKDDYKQLMKWRRGK